MSEPTESGALQSAEDFKAAVLGKAPAAGGLLEWQPTSESARSNAAPQRPAQEEAISNARDAGGLTDDTVFSSDDSEAQDSGDLGGNGVQPPEKPEVSVTAPASPGDDEGQTAGNDAQSPELITAKLLEKFGVASAGARPGLPKLRELAGKPPGERDAALGEIEEVLSAYFEPGPDGKLELRADAAARRLSAARKKSTESLELLQAPPVDEKTVRAQIEQEERASLEEYAEDAEALEQIMASPRRKQIIDARVKERIHGIESERTRKLAHEYGITSEKIRAFVAANPGIKEEHLEQMSEVLEAMPEPLRRLVVNNDMLDLGVLYRGVRYSSDLKQISNEAFLAGRKFERSNITPRDSGKPGSVPPGRRRNSADGPAGDIKERVRGIKPMPWL